MKEVRKDNARMTDGQKEALKKFGKIQITDLTKLKEIVPEDPNKPVYGWIVNVSNGTAIASDLDLTLEHGQAIYLPENYKIEEINSSNDLRNLVEMQVMKSVEDPTTVAVKKLKPLTETLPKGTHVNVRRHLGPNPYNKKYKDEQRKEKAEIEKLANQGEIKDEE